MEICKNTTFLSDYIAAGRADLDPERLSYLANNAEHKIRLRTAENPNTPVDVLRRLSQDSHEDVQIAVALNPATPEEIIYRLITESTPTVRFAIAESLETSSKHLEMLAQDTNPYVSCRALDTLALKSVEAGKSTARIFQWTDYMSNPLRFG